MHTRQSPAQWMGTFGRRRTIKMTALYPCALRMQTMTVGIREVFSESNARAGCGKLRRNDLLHEEVRDQHEDVTHLHAKPCIRAPRGLSIPGKYLPV